MSGKKKPAAKRSAPQVNRGVTPNEAREGQDLSPVTDSDKKPVAEYSPKHPELEHKDFDQHSAEEKRQAELAEERDEHNRRTGDASR